MNQSHFSMATLMVYIKNGLLDLKLDLNSNCQTSNNRAANINFLLLLPSSAENGLVNNRQLSSATPLQTARGHRAGVGLKRGGACVPPKGFLIILDNWYFVKVSRFLPYSCYHAHIFDFTPRHPYITQTKPYKRV